MSTTTRGTLVIAAVILATQSGCAKEPPATLAAQPPRPGLLSRIQSAAAGIVARKINSQYDDVFNKYTKQYFGPGFDWRWFKAQGFAESRLDPHAKSWVGARGLMQLMPTTYHEIVSQNPDFGPIDQPEWNIAAGIYYNRRLWDFWHLVPYDERHRFMFASYNAGRGPIIKAYNIIVAQGLDTTWANVVKLAPGIHPWRYTETVGYVRRIDAVYGVLTNANVTASTIDTL
jgi:soluble lytic murein transglycosylase-like protein